MLSVAWDIGAFRPIVVAVGEAPVIFLLLEAVSKDIGGAVVAELCDDALSTVRGEMHTVKTDADGFLDGALAGHIFLMALFPSVKLI